MEDSVVSPGACVQPWDAPEEPLGVGRKCQNFPFCLFAFLKVVRVKFIHGFKEVSDTCFTLVVGLILTIALGGEDYYNPHLHRKLRLRGFQGSAPGQVTARRCQSSLAGSQLSLITIF